MSSTPADASTSSQVASSSATPTRTDDEVEKLLNRQASALNRELEVERILKAFKLNPYEMLDVDETATAEDIKKKYKQLSLFIHPDKTSHPRASEAFDLLKKAESELSDKTKREELDAIIAEARLQVLKAHQIPTSVDKNDKRVRTLIPPFRVQLLAKAKELLIEEEVRRRKAIKMNLANEGLEAKKKEEEVLAKKRKAEDDKVWEETREQRVDSWRSFANNNKKKKKTKVQILG